MLSKLCTDFYNDDDIACAKDILYNITEAHHDRRRVKHRGSDKKQRDMQDVLNIFLELPLHAIPIFVCKDISNLPPLSMNNFDMASVIRSIETLQVQVNLSTENHTKSVNAQVTLCKHLIPSADNTTQAAVAPTSDTLPAVNTSEINAGNAEHQHHSIFSDDNSDGGDEVVTVIGDSDSDDRDLIRLAEIQKRTNIHRKRQHARPQGMTNRPNDQRSPRANDDVIAGNGTSTHIRTATKNQRQSTLSTHRQRVGIFVSRMSRSTRARHIDRHVEQEAGIKVHCEEIPSKYENTNYRSFFIRLNSRNLQMLLQPDMWPRDTIVRGYYE